MCVQSTKSTSIPSSSPTAFLYKHGLLPQLLLSFSFPRASLRLTRQLKTPDGGMSTLISQEAPEQACSFLSLPDELIVSILLCCAVQDVLRVESVSPSAISHLVATSDVDRASFRRRVVTSGMFAVRDRFGLRSSSHFPLSTPLTCHLAFPSRVFRLPPFVTRL